MARITLWNDYKEHNEVINIELGKLSNQNIEQNKPTWDKAGNSVQISQDYNGVKINSTNGIEVVSSKNALLLNASKGIELKRKDNSEIIFGVDTNGDLIVKGNINMVGGSILWDKVTAPDYSKIKGGPPTDATNTWSDLTGDDRIKGIFFTKDGKLAIKADAISIGSNTVYETGYDPTKIEVGGDNLFRDSIFKKGMTYYTQVPGVSIDTSVIFRGYPTMKSDQSGNTSLMYRGLEQRNLQFVIGKTYTASFYVMSDNVSTFDDILRIEIICEKDDNSRTATFRTDIDIKGLGNNNWGKFTCTGTIPPETTKVRVGCRVWKNGRVWIALPMFEQGTIASDHKLSKEDIADVIQVGTRNYLLNSDFRYFYEDQNSNIAWDKAKNGILFPNQAWSNGYNAGVPDPTIGYHAHWNVSQFGYPVVEFINRNSDINRKNRWLGISQYIGAERIKEIRFEPGKEYTISFEAYSDTVGFFVSTGLMHFSTDNPDKSSFRSYYWDYKIQNANTWERFYATFKIDEKVIFNKDMYVYLYGANNASAPEGTAWVRNMKLEEGNQATAWSLAPEEADRETKNATNRNDIVRVRYIRDFLDGNTANSANHWVAIKAMRGGVDVAQGRPVVASGPEDPVRPLSIITNGSTTSGTWTSVGGGNGVNGKWVQVDLGQAYEDIDYIQVWHYYQDGRTYYKTRVDVSNDTSNWVTLFDSKVSGTYQETDKGFIVPVNPNRYFNSVDTQFKVVDGKISSKVESTTYTNDKNAMDKRMTSVEQTAKGIDVILKQEGTNKVVDGRAIIGQINLTPSDAKIRFENIQIDGKVTFNSFDTSTQNKINDINLSSELAQVKPDILQGKTLYNDPTFEYGMNSIQPYNNLSNGNVVVTRIQNESTSPTTSTGMLSIKTNGPATPNLGGFTFSTMTRANATFIVRFIARIPTGYKVVFGSNGIGTGGSTKWLTSTEGTGKWEEYVIKINCGYSGTFSTTAFFSLWHSSATTVTWHLAYATVIDSTNVNNSISDVITGGPNLVSGTTFSKPDGWLPWSGKGTVGVYEAFGPAAPCVYVSTKVDGVNMTLAAGTTVGLENAGKTFPVRAGRQYTVSAEIATSELGDTLDYMYLMHKQISAGNMRLPNIKVTDFPKAVPISVGSATYYYKVEFTFVADVNDDNASILFCGTTARDLPGTNNVGYAWIRIAKLKVEEGNKASPWSLSPSDVADTIVVGGNNLIPDSLFKKGTKWRSWGAGSGSRLLAQKVDLAGFDTGFTFAASTTGEFGYAIDGVPVTKDETYTLSAWFKLDKAGVVKVQEGDTTVKWTSTNLSPPINKWVRITHTFVAKGNTTSLYFGQDNTGNSVTSGYVTGAQLERGNKATDWSLANEDLYQAINDVEIGGNNLLKNSAFTSLDGWGGVNSTNIETYDSSSNSVLLRRNNFVAGNPRYQMAQTATVFNTTAGSNYTLSALIYVDSSFALVGGNANSLSARFFKASDGGLQDLIVIDLSTLPKNKWVKVSGSVQIPNDIKTNVEIMLSINQNGAIKIAKPQFEVGNKATDWSPSTDDIVNMNIGGRNLLLNSQLPSIFSNNASVYPIDVYEQTEGNIKFLRVKNSKKGTDVNTFSLYNALPLSDMTDSLSGKQITISHKVRANKTVDMKLMALTYLQGTGTIVRFPDDEKVFKVNGSWSTVSTTVVMPNNMPGTTTGIRFILYTPTSTQPDLYVDYRDWKIEVGSKATDWNPAPEDVDKSISTSEQNAKDYTNVISSNESSYFNRNYNFADWTGTLPAGFKGVVGATPTKVPSESGNGNSARFLSTAGQGSYFDTDGKSMSLYQHYYVEFTFKLESGSASASGVLFRFMAADGKILYDQHLKIKDLVGNPIIGKWYTVSSVFKVAPLANFSMYRIYAMGSWSAFDSTMPACSILFDSIITRPATSQEVSAFESDALLQNKKGTWDSTTSLVDSWKGAAVNGKTTINGGLLETNTVTAEHIAIGDFSNLSQADEMKDLIYPTTLIGTTKYYKIGPAKYSPLQLNKLNNKDFKVGDELYFSCFGYKEGNFGVTLILRYYYKGSWVNAGMATIGFNTSLGAAECTLKITQDIDTSKELISVNLFMEKDGATDVGYYYLRNIEVRRKNNGRMIIDGSIDANHVKANAITANHIKAGTITANEIAGNTITAAEINMSNLTANTAFINAIKATSISADKISGGTISGVTINVSTDAYVGNKLQIGSHTSAAYKEISFNGVSRISNQGSNGEIVKISAMHTNINDGHVGLGGMNYRVSVSGEFDLSNVQRFIGGIPAVFA